MAYVHCPFCGQRVPAGAGHATPGRCPRCGAFTLHGEVSSDEDRASPFPLPLGTTGSELRTVQGPDGPVSFIRTQEPGEEPQAPPLT